jgi:hypothetical protein
LNITAAEVQELLVFLILDHKVNGNIDQVNQLLILRGEYVSSLLPLCLPTANTFFCVPHHQAGERQVPLHREVGHPAAQHPQRRPQQGRLKHTVFSPTFAVQTTKNTELLHKRVGDSFFEEQHERRTTRLSSSSLTYFVLVGDVWHLESTLSTYKRCTTFY